jgi:hydrogenase-4 component E
MSRLGACIRIVALQGFLLGMFTFIIESHALSLRVTLLGLVNMGLKGMVFPLLLFWAIKDAGISREVSSYMGYIKSILTGILMVALSFGFSSRVSLPLPIASELILPVALSTLLSGLLLVASRRNALMQVLGYLVIENGIYTFAIATVGRFPLLVELGVLLDVFVAVLVMVVAIHQIHREFEHIDVAQLNVLKG